MVSVMLISDGQQNLSLFGTAVLVTHVREARLFIHKYFGWDNAKNRPLFLIHHFDEFRVTFKVWVLGQNLKSTFR